MQTVNYCGIPLNPRVQGAHAGISQQLLRRIDIGLKAERQLQNRIPRGILCSFEKLMTEGSLYISPFYDPFRHFAAVCA
ncbi:MAG: hypothetical protein EOM14_10790 [Clostridia bacterium]|nr:hypothetical protein [Clostridia bacterium]